jgi:quercetin dioxygenase-like cupin family protein
MHNPVTGDVYEFMETSKDTNGERVTMKATISGKGKMVPNHIHVLQDESYEVTSGVLTIWQDGVITKLPAGEKMTLARNKPHNHYNDADLPVSYIHSVTPALDFDYLVENLIGLAGDGKSNHGKYGLVQEMVTLKYLDSKTYLSDIPVGIQKGLMYIIAPIGRLLGYRAIYEKYSGIEK